MAFFISKMIFSLSFSLPDGRHECDEYGVAYHVHFPGSTEVSSGFVPDDGIVKGLTCPKDGEAVCVTLVKRMKHGWIRHSRCRFDLSSAFQRLTLKDEQLDTGNPRYGTVEFTTDAAVKSRGQILQREWFFIPKTASDVFSRSDNEWFENIRGSCEFVSRVHAPWWNNKPNSKVPGWCFAFPPPGPGYDRHDLREMFSLAKNMLVNKQDSLNDVLALGVTLFGLSIFYEMDHTVRSNKIVERFSSGARRDGLGDCEDVAKESAMAFGDLKTTDFGSDLFMRPLGIIAKAFQFCICLGAVRRSVDRDIEAHAFGLLVPNALFPDDMLTPEEKKIKEVQINEIGSMKFRTYMCDGVYSCHPTKKKDTNGSSTILSQEAPWKYEKIISAFVYDKGEVYFAYKNDRRYGVDFDKVFPSFLDDIYLCNALGDRASLPERKLAANEALKNNLPRATRTYGYESERVLDRFESVTRLTKFRAKRFMQVFNSMNQNTLLRFKALENNHAGECTSLKASEPDGRSSSEFDPPKVEDFISFAARRVVSLLRKKKQDTRYKYVTTRQCVYELNDIDEPNGVVTTVFLRVGKRSEIFSDRDVLEEVCKEVRERVLGDETHRITLDDGNGKFVLHKNIEDYHSHDSYLNFLKRKLGIICLCESYEDYGRRCGNI